MADGFWLLSSGQSVLQPVFDQSTDPHFQARMDYAGEDAQFELFVIQPFRKKFVELIVSRSFIYDSLSRSCMAQYGVPLSLVWVAPTGITEMGHWLGAIG